MPLFEYVCEECEKPFEKLVRNGHTVTVHCPACDSDHVRKLLSTFVARGSSIAPSSGGGCGKASCPSGCSCGARH